MNEFNVYKDIQARTGGEIYLGVVGPVRTGKSTFIRRFMETMVLPGMEDEHVQSRARDELPQAASGKTIMTTEPKFIPKEAADVALAPDVTMAMRLIDCVGYMVDGAVGHVEGEQERLVKTPWFDYEIPFTKAAEIGTQKVINDHSTIGMVITTDGSIGEITRNEYIPAEEKTVAELKKLRKPFVILLNSLRPYGEETQTLARELEDKYEVNVVPVNCEQLKKDDIVHIMEKVLEEFPVTEIFFNLPKWVEILPDDHWMKLEMVEMAKKILADTNCMRDVNQMVPEELPQCLKQVRVDKRDLSNGQVNLDMQIDQPFYYQIISDYTGMPITGEYQLMKTLLELSKLKTQYQKVEHAMEDVRFKGYGIVTPERGEIMLDEPQVMKHGNKYGVKMKAVAPSIHLIRSNIETEIAPIVGSEEQAADLVTYIKQNAATADEGIWQTNIFGKSIEQIVDDGINAKVSQLTEESQTKLQDALQKIINDSNGGLICIII